MIDGALELALGNVPASLALTGLAYAVHRSGRYPALAHLLWVVVLIKVITPPLLMLSVPLATPTAIAGDAMAVGATIAAAPSVSERALSMAGQIGTTALVLAWALGSIIALAISMRRMRAFGRLLGSTSRRANRPLEQLTASVGYELGLKSVPPVFVTSARIAPMTWWSRGRIRLVLPASLLRRSDRAELRWVLAHELAHVKRYDHLVRWIEWLVAVAFWWNPVVWFARRNLRLDEEDACDALVVGHIEGSPRAYASALLDAVEAISQTRGHVPAMATGIDAARSLEHRLRAIVSPSAGRSAPRPLVGGLTAVALLALSVGVGPGAAAGDSETRGTDLAEPATAIGAAEEPAPDTTRYAAVSATLPGTASGKDADYVGTSGDDTYIGDAHDEVIIGLAGADELNGKAGRDTIRGGSGPDVIRGGAGHDELHGGAGPDTIRGGAGRDTISAGAGADTVYSWADGTPDRIDCGDGPDRAVIDSTDTTRACEDVIVRDPA